MGSETQTRILNHMNSSHKLAIEDYLAVYGEVIISDKIVNIKMKDIELDHIDISFNHMDIEFEIVKPIPIDPPMADFGEARDKLVEMAKKAAAKRGFSHIQITDVVYPSQILEFILIALVILCLVSCFYPTLVFDYFLNHILPKYVCSLLHTFRKAIAITGMLIHIVEYQIFLSPKLKYYRVPPDFKIEWIALCLLDGQATIRRFNNLAKDIESGKKH